MSPARKSEAEEAPTTCSWCSASVPASAAKCPSCGASLRDAADGEILGVTQIDPHATSRAGRTKPGRIATWLGAEAPLEPTDLGGKIETPSKEVREEMLRLEIAAIDAEIEAKATQAELNRTIAAEDEPDADRTAAAQGQPDATPTAAAADEEEAKPS
jgi:hypothetical protein